MGSIGFDSWENTEKILSIEKRMGRVRKKGQGYSSRIIDIDLLFVDGKELVMKELVVPHPEIANRRFVPATHGRIESTVCTPHS